MLDPASRRTVNAPRLFSDVVRCTGEPTWVDWAWDSAGEVWYAARPAAQLRGPMPRSMPLSTRLRGALVAALLWPLFACDQDPEDGFPADKEDAARAVIDDTVDWEGDVCEVREWYEDGACDWFCPDPDPDCDGVILGPEPGGQATRYPIVLMHGFNAGREGAWSFYRVEGALRADGHTVYTAEVPPFASVAERAGALAPQIDRLLRETGAARVNLVAHSMGGLDARYYTRVLRPQGVSAVVTISTPHRGSRVADAGLGLIPDIADDAIDFLAALWGRTYNEVAEDADVRAALTALSSDEAARFNAEVTDVPGVEYLSWAGVSSVLGIVNPLDRAACDGMLLGDGEVADRMNAQLVAGAALLAGIRFTPNDGMSTVASAKWGAFQGCIPADHFDEVGQPERDRPDPHTGFDHVRFYRDVAFDLAAEGH